jgi:hypothetical protein
MRKLLWAVILLASGLAPTCRAQSDRALGQVDPVEGIVYLRPFVLERPYLYSMTKDPFEVRAGSIVVLRVDRNLARPREVGMPVLYAGPVPVELTNPGYWDGTVVGIVPSRVDVRSAPFFFGSGELPEQVDLARGEAELTAAASQGIRAFPDDALVIAADKGGDTLRVADIDLLYSALSDLIMTYAPSDSDWAKGYRILP